MATYLGDCGCKGVRANVAIIQWNFFGYAPFVDASDYQTTYLRYDRVIISGREYLTQIGIDTYEGWVTLNKWNNNTTVSHPFFILPTEISSLSEFADVTATSRTWIIRNRTGYDQYGNPVHYDLVMAETLSTPWTTTEWRQQMYDDLTDSVPWENPFIFDLEHRIHAYFNYDENGNLQLNPNVSMNPVVFADEFPCVGSVVCSQDRIGPGAIPFPGISAFRMKFRQRLQKRYAGQPPLFNCGDPAPGVAIGDSYMIEAEEIIRPPTQAELTLAGAGIGEWGHTATIGC